MLTTMLTLLKTLQRSIALKLILYHLLSMRIVSRKPLALQSFIQELLIEDIILLLLNSQNFHLGFSVMMPPSLYHLRRKQIILLHIFTSIMPFKKIILPCFVRGLQCLSLSLDVRTLHITPDICQFCKESLSRKGAWMSFLVFRCNNPTYYLNFITLYANNVVGLLAVGPYCLACQQLNFTPSQGY